MHKYEQKTEYGIEYIRITKREAKTRYENYDDIIICPCKVSLASPWHLYSVVNACDRNDIYNDMLPDHAFDNLVRHYIIYNCQFNENGYYPAFYKPIFKLTRLQQEQLDNMNESRIYVKGSNDNWRLNNDILSSKK